MSQIKNYFSKNEIYLWMLSSFFIIASFCIFDRENYLTLCASLIGVTSLIFNAKGNPAGQILMVIFSIIYGIISYSFCYYGEMITYLGMTMPMSVMAMISWFSNPFEKRKMEVKVNTISKKEHFLMWIMALVVTVVFYFILKSFFAFSLQTSIGKDITWFIASKHLPPMLTSN